MVGVKSDCLVSVEVLAAGAEELYRKPTGRARRAARRLPAAPRILSKVHADAEAGSLIDGDLPAQLWEGVLARYNES